MGVMTAKYLTHPKLASGSQWRNRPGVSPASLRRHARSG